MALRPTQNNVLLKGTSGCGKSYFVVDWIVNEILPYSDAKVVTNLPLGLVPVGHFEPPAFEGETFLDRIYARVPRGEGRISLLSLEEMEPWKTGEGGPWDLDLAGETFFILDEMAKYCHTNHKLQAQIEWINWFAEARHLNVWNICIPQNDKKIPNKIRLEFGERWQLSDTAGLEMPFGILEGDFNQLLSKCFGRDVAATQVIVRLDEGGTISAKGTPHRVSRHTEGYRLYDSFSAPAVGTEGSSRKKAWERLSWPLFITWFVGRNKWLVVKAFAFAWVVILVFTLDFRSLIFGDREITSNGVEKNVEVTEVVERVEPVEAVPVVIAEEPPEDPHLVGWVGDRQFRVDGVSRGLYRKAGPGVGQRVGPDFGDTVTIGDN